MAQKAAKQLRTRNTAILNRLHLISLILNLFFILFRFLYLRRSANRNSYILYILLAAPSFIIEFWFESIGRPSVSKSGEDLEAKGLTEYLWDVLYWSWGCIGLAALVGDRVWWAWAVVPLYSIYLAWTTYTGMKGGLGGLMGAGAGGEGEGASSGGESKMQKKIEKRGGQKVQYR